MYIESFIEIKKREKTNGGNSNISTAFLFQILSNNQSIYNSFIQEMRRKNHTCEERGPHFKTSVWHLLMNLKNNYLLKTVLKQVNKKWKNFRI